MPPDIKKFSIETIAMLEPILQEKQFVLAGLKLDKKLQKIEKEKFNTESKELELQIYNLQKRLAREFDVLAKS